jgi:Meiotically up-regulated gene 113
LYVCNVIRRLYKKGQALVDEGNRINQPLTFETLVACPCKGFIFLNDMKVLVDLDFIEKMNMTISQGVFWFYLKDNENKFPVSNIDGLVYFEVDLNKDFKDLGLLGNNKDTFYRWLTDFYKRGMIRLVKKRKYQVRFIHPYENDFLVENKPKTMIYLMLDEHTGLYKIGRSYNAEHREKTLLSQCPKIKLLFSFLATYPTEKKLHEKFKDKRKRGEWFELSQIDVEYIENFQNEKQDE